MTSPTIRLLLVEDNPADALLLRHALADAVRVVLRGHARGVDGRGGPAAWPRSASTRSCWTFRCPTAAG